MFNLMPLKDQHQIFNFSNNKRLLFCKKIKKESLDCHLQNKVKVFGCTCQHNFMKGVRGL